MIAMETMKASRRKQTKPNRVPFGMDPDTGAFNATLPAHPPSGPHEEDLPRHNGGMEVEGDESDAPLDMHVSIISCRMCPETFPTSADLRDHVDVAHGSMPKKTRMDSEFPTAYHRLGSELFQENSLMPNGHSESQEQALSLTKPKPQSDPRDFEDPSRDQSGEGRSVKVDGGKIFHPDAYCELCDREFCNKYFLKTHRANKHGIFDRSSPSTPTPPDGPQNPYEVNLPAPPPPKVELSPSPWQQQQQSKKENNSKQENQQSSSSCKRYEAELDTQKKVSSVITAVMNSMSSSQSDTKPSSSTSSASSSSGSTPKDPSMEDYCEFCQKHFCNKYYLKKHKQDVHGIIPETGPTTTKRSRASSSLLDLPMSTSMGSPILLPQPMASLGGMPALPPGVMVLNPFMPQMTLIPTGSMPQPLLHAHQLHHPPQSPVMSQHHPLSASLPGISPNTPTSQASQLSPSLDTYCSQCRKEFSNPYFLKIHKANRHGMPSDELPPDAKLLSEMVESNGIIVPPRPSSKDVKQEAHSRPSPPPLTSINQMVTCRQCDKDFPNAQAFKIHQITEHGKNLEPSLPDSYESSLPKSEPPVSSSESLRRMSSEASAAHGGSSNGSGGTTMFGNIVAAKLADRVVCDICNKDLCNKYFLKSHKLKMHGVDMDKEEGRASTGEKSQQQSPTPLPSSKAQPINMSMGSKPSPGLMPKLELRDFQDYGRDFKMMEKYGAFKNFADVPTFLSETINNEYLRRSHTQPPFKGLDFGMQGLVPTSTANLSHDQLVEEGIDPEAYCDICKKEFCSKYFLRTHKQNIHGIKVEAPPPDRSRAKPGPKPALSKINSMSSGSNGNMLAGLPMPTMPFNFPPSLMMGGSNGGGNSGLNRSRDSFEKHQFRWKDPSNSQRVTCDICNKEVCNKYFLRTHKLKKHGIAPSDTSLSPMSGSPVPSENDGSSNHSSQPDNFLLDKGAGMFPRSEGLPVPQSIPLPPSERSSKPGGEQQPPKVGKSEEEKSFLHSKHHHNNNNNNNNNNNREMDAVTCHLCERKFRSMQWLSAHLMKDHAEACNPELMDLRMLPPPLGHAAQFGAELEPKMCQVCRHLLPNEISLQLHLIQEHNAQVRLQMEEAPRYKGQQQLLVSSSSSSSAGSSRTVGLKAVKPWRFAARKQGLTAVRKQKMYVCSGCHYQTHWLCKLQAHEEAVHGIVASSSSSSSDKGQSLGEGASAAADKALLGLKQFKCGLCPSRFTTHAYCQMHLREAHIHMLKDFVSRKRDRAGKKLFCTFCSFSTSFLFRLHSHVSRYHRRPLLPNGQRKSIVNTSEGNDVVSSNTMPAEGGDESLDGSPVRDTVTEASSFERQAAAADGDLMKQTFHMAGDENEAAVTLTDKFMSSMPVRQRVHEPVSASFRMTEVTP